MLRSKLILFTPILFVIVACFLFLRPSPKASHVSVSPGDPGTIDPKREAEIAAIIEQYPMLAQANRTARMNQSVSSWEEWVRVQAEVSTGSAFMGYYEPATFTPDEYLEMYEKMYAGWTEIAERYQRKNATLPPTAASRVSLPSTPKSMYEGPQTVEAIMAEFDDKYRSNAEKDELYPRDSFLQRVLDKGVVIKESSDYSYWMQQRGMLLYKKDHPDDWKSGSFGIPPTTDFTEYEEEFLERQVWEHSIIQQVSESNPGQSVSVYFPSSHPDVYLPKVGRMTYVYRSGSRTETTGSLLTKEQFDNLVHKGIEPEDIEIVYIDEDYNVLSEDPPPWPDFDVDPMTGRVSFNGVLLTPENYESVVGYPIPAEVIASSPVLKGSAIKRSDIGIPEEFQSDSENLTVGWPGRFDQSSDSLSSDESLMNPAEAFANAAKSAREAAIAAREAAKAEYEKFENRMRQLEEFSTMSDAEIEKKLERQFRKQFLPEHPVEQLEQIKPQRLERALGTLFQYGYEDGMRRIREDNATLADLLERHFGKRTQPPASVPKNPPRPEPPKPVETTDTSPDTE